MECSNAKRKRTMNTTVRSADVLDGGSGPFSPLSS
jgi:hypothetical protein